MSHLNLSNDLRAYLISNGASMVGYADLSALPNESTQGYKYGVSIVAALNKKIISGIGNGPTQEYYNEYIRLNELLDQLDLLASDYLKERGYDAFPKVRSNVTIDETTRRTILPHKTVATRAGIGWIGKCALLITKEYGSAVRISSVLTNAELDAGAPIDHSNCNSCDICRKMCPGNAVKGINWSVDLDRDVFYNAFDCRRTAVELSGRIGINQSLCGKCIFVCPWTTRYLEKQ